MPFTNIIGHIAGLPILYRDELNNLLSKSSILKNIDIIDFDIITEKILNDNNMTILYSRYEKYLIISKDKTIPTIDVKTALQNIKETEQKMTRYWKAKVEYYLNKLISNHKHKILLVGFISYFKNHKIHINLNIIQKFFVKVDYEDHAKSLIKYNIENSKDDIIDGSFDLNYLNKDFLIKKRFQIQTIYTKLGYVTLPLKLIVNILEICQQTSNPDTLYYASFTKFDKKVPTLSTTLLAYPLDWLALLYIINDEHIKKGIKNDIPYVILNKDQRQKLNKSCYLYEIIKTEQFIPIPSGDTVYKYCTLHPPKINRMLEINNIINQLKDLSVNINT